MPCPPQCQFSECYCRTAKPNSEATLILCLLTFVKWLWNISVVFLYIVNFVFNIVHTGKNVPFTYVFYVYVVLLHGSVKITLRNYITEIVQLQSCLYNDGVVFLFSYACHLPWLVSHETASSSAKCSRDKPPFSFVRGQDSTMWDIVVTMWQCEMAWLRYNMIVCI